MTRNGRQLARARAASGHAAAAPPSATNNFRRPMVTVIRPSRARAPSERNNITPQPCGPYARGRRDAGLMLGRNVATTTLLAAARRINFCELAARPSMGGTGLPACSRGWYMRPAEASEIFMSKRWLRRLHTALVVLALALVPLGTAVNAADDLHKVAVVSFGLFGDQRVFQSEATGAAQIVASRF